MKQIIWSFLMMTFATGCSTLKPYEKQHLVHPLMSDGFKEQLDSSILSRQTVNDQRLKVGGSSNGSSSCPTCGG